MRSGAVPSSDSVCHLRRFTTPFVGVFLCIGSLKPRDGHLVRWEKGRIFLVF